MNGRFIADATSLERSETLAAISDSPFLNTAQRIEALYLATLARKPRPRELSRLVDYVDREGGRESSPLAVTKVVHEPGKRPSGSNPPNRKDRALADVLWALLNSSEFILNH
jgi:hypothetical protein